MKENKRGIVCRNAAHRFPEHPRKPQGSGEATAEARHQEVPRQWRETGGDGFPEPSAKTSRAKPRRFCGVIK